MAEILLSLTIIGVVAAITLPSLTGNINERTWNTQRKALYSRMSQAISLMPSIKGYGTFRTEGFFGESIVEDTTATAFVTDGLAKVLKINNICDNEHLSDCGLPDKVMNMNGSAAFSTFPKTQGEYNSLPNVRAAFKFSAFETANGESIAVVYNPECLAYDLNFLYGQQTQGYSGNVYAGMYVCANFIYDLNGKKGPNTMGKDIGFMSVFSSGDPKVVAPMPDASDNPKGSYNYYSLLKLCRAKDERLPNLEELMSISVNRPLVVLQELKSYFSTTRVAQKPSGLWTVFGSSSGHIEMTDPLVRGLVGRCVKR